MVQNKKGSVKIIVSTEAREQVEQPRDEIRDRFWRAVERIRERNADRDPDEILREVTEVVEEVRQERYDRARRFLELARS